MVNVHQYSKRSIKVHLIANIFVTYTADECLDVDGSMKQPIVKSFRYVVCRHKTAYPIK